MFSNLHSLIAAFTRGTTLHFLRMTLLFALPAVLVTACPEGDDDDTSSAGDDDDTGSAGDDDDLWADDDDAADDDDDDDAASGDACSVEVGPEGMTIQITGTCQESTGDCDGGYDELNPTGSCASGLTCCVDVGQCEAAMMGTCAASEDDCEGEPPPDAPGFPMFGCPQSTPYCCLPEPPMG